MRSLVEAMDVERTFRKRGVVEALAPTELAVSAGEFVAVMGISGSGKSTLLNILGLIDRPTGGEYLLDGVATSALRRRERTALRRVEIGFVFQAFHLLGELTCVENVELALALADVRRSRRRVLAVERLEELGLLSRVNARASELSGGEQQRVAVARATAHGPRLLLADEPTGNLDPESESLVLEALRGAATDRRAVVVATHSERVAGCADRVIRLPQQPQGASAVAPPAGAASVGSSPSRSG